MTPEEIKTVLGAHKEWAAGRGGKRADLSGADLSGADLSGADLSRADLSRAKLSPEHVAVFLVARVTRTEDPYEFFGWSTNKGLMVTAGCRFLSVADYRAHVGKEYPDTTKAAETLAILEFIEARFKAAEVKS